MKMLEDIRNKALANQGATVELPFGDDTQTFTLTVTRDMVQGSWMWMLYRSDGFASGLEWSHVTHDVDFIYTLVSNANPNFILKARTSSTAEMEKLAPVDQSQSQTIRLRRATIEGNFKNIQMANLLQSISMGQMTGRLEITSAQDKANVYFKDGRPLHAALRGAEGNEAMLQLFAWDDGDFAFYDEQVNVTQTVTRGLTGLLMEGAGFVDHLNYLKNQGLTHESYPIRLKSVTSEEELKALTKEGIDCDLKLQLSIYKKINNTNNWAEILRDLSVPKSQWVPVMFNLISCGLIRLDKSPPTAKKIESKIDSTALQAFENNLCRPDTGLYSYPAFLYFAQQEYNRFEGFRLPFAIIVFGVCDKHSTANQFIPFKTRAIAELKQKIMRTKRKTDFLCHFGAFAFAMLLPLTTKDSAVRMAEILAEICSGVTISDEYAPSQLEFRVGVSSISSLPGDCTSLDEMINSAENVRALS